jgi:hypothetical protein
LLTLLGVSAYIARMLNTVNVLEVIDRKPNALFTWEENAEGNRRAESHFRSLVLIYNANTPQNIPDAEEMEACIEDGVYENLNNEYQLFIVHSIS